MEAEEIALVVFGGFTRTAALNFEMFDKITNEFRNIHKSITTLGRVFVKRHRE